MMKKNLFILFSLYFFVFQPIILGLLRGEYNFFYLSVINLFFIVIIRYFSKEHKVETQEVNLEPEIDLYEKINYVQKQKSHKKISHVWFFVISVLFGLFLWFWIPDIILSLKLISIVFGSFVLFILFGLLFKFRISKIWELKLYLIILLGLFVRYITILFDINFSNNIKEITDVNISGNTGIYFVSVDEYLTGESLNLESIGNEDASVDFSKNATFADVIKYLIDINSIKLLENKNIKFDYVSYNNVEYPYYRTAYSLGMIGKTLNPSKTLLCETFVVMMGLAEKWNVGSYLDIKKAYWDYAQTNNKLPDCNYGKFLTMADFR